VLVRTGLQPGFTSRWFTTSRHAVAAAREAFRLILLVLRADAAEQVDDAVVRVDVDVVGLHVVVSGHLGLDGCRDRRVGKLGADGLVRAATFDGRHDHRAADDEQPGIQFGEIHERASM
jgi:hypothetical protein